TLKTHPSIAGFPSIAMAYLNEEFSPKAIGMGVYVAGTALGGFLGRVIIGGLTGFIISREGI
ncbi:hypothetical protein M5W68_11820, partial [Paenibacillus larvae]|nr:hypothetical protein [Paenibacillus larvae]